MIRCVGTYLPLRTASGLYQTHNDRDNFSSSDRNIKELPELSRI